MSKTRKKTKQAKPSRTAARRAAKRPVARTSGVTAAAYAATLRRAIRAAPPSMQGDNLPVKALRSRYGPAPKRTLMAALNLLASEGLVTIVNDEEFQVNARPTRR